MSEIAPTPHNRRWLMPVLIVSLAFNFLILGVASARIWHHMGDRHHMGGYHETAGHHKGGKRSYHQARHGRHMLYKLGREMPDEVRDAVRDAMRESGGTQGKGRHAQRFEQMRNLMEDAATRLQAEDFDREGFEAGILTAYEAMNERIEGRVERFASVLAAALAELPADERQEAGEDIAEVLEEWDEKSARYKKKRQDDD